MMKARPVSSYKAHTGFHDRIDRCARSKLRKIYAVSWDGKEYFPAYQFSEAAKQFNRRR